MDEIMKHTSNKTKTRHFSFKSENKLSRLNFINVSNVSNVYLFSLKRG